MSNDRIPVALKVSPTWWPHASMEKKAAAVQAAFGEFDQGNVYVETWGLRVTTSVPCIGALDSVVRANERLKVAVEYAVVDMVDDVITVAA